MRIFTLVFSAVLMLSCASMCPAQTVPAPYHRDVPTRLAVQAKVPEAAACKAALSTVKDGRIVALELERENGKLLYSIDIRVPGKPGIEEVHVSALDASVLLVKHESAKDERAEAAADKKRTD